ncbi:3-oxoacyl-[acyl-carrier-protein] reductase [Sarracenia purpurea var. burkii]
MLLYPASSPFKLTSLIPPKSSPSPTSSSPSSTSNPISSSTPPALMVATIRPRYGAYATLTATMEAMMKILAKELKGREITVTQLMLEILNEMGIRRVSRGN